MSKKTKVVTKDKRQIVYDPITHDLTVKQACKDMLHNYLYKFKEYPIDINSIKFKFRKDGSFTATGVKVFFEVGKPRGEHVWVYMRRGRKLLTEADLEVVRGMANAFTRMCDIKQLEPEP